MAGVIKMKDDIINEYRPMVIEKLSVNHLLTSLLVQKGIVTTIESERLYLDSIPRFEKASLIMDYLSRGPESAWDKFLLCLVESGQEHMVSLLSGELRQDREIFEERIKRSKNIIMEKLRPRHRLRQLMKEKAILDTTDVDWLSNVQVEENEKVEYIMKALWVKHSSKWTDFISCLMDDGQVQLARHIDHEETDQLKQHKKIYDPTIWMKHLMERHKHISRTVPIFKNVRMFKEYIADMTKLFTKLELLHGTQTTDHDLADVSLEEVLDGSKKNIIFQGCPGSGKSCAILHILTTCEEGMKGDSPGEARYKVMNDVMSLIHIKPQDCKESLETTVKSVLEDQCPEYSEQAYRHFLSNPEETGLLLDSFDEVSDKAVLIEDVLKEMKRNKRVIIAGCRSHDPVLDPFIHVEHVKQVRVIGFDPSAITSYVEKYFMQDDETRKEVIEKNSNIVKAFKQSLRTDRCLEGILTNPMTLCIASILIKAGKYEPNKLTGLTKIKIYSDIEELVLDREGLKPEEEKDNLHKFHKYAFCAVVKGTGFYQQEMEDLTINTANLPFITIGGGNIAERSKGCQVLWPHRSFSEYCAAKCVVECNKNKREELLLYLAANRKLINTLIFILELMEPEEELLTKVVNYVLSLQHTFDPPWHIFTCRSKGTKAMKAKISMASVSDLLEHSEQCLPKASDKLCPCKRCWKKLNLATAIEGQAVLHNAQLCLRTKQNSAARARVFSQTLPDLLPRNIDDGLLLPVPGTDRFVTIQKKSGGVMHLNANRPSDLVTAKPFLMWGNEELQKVWMDLGRIDDMYGLEAGTSTQQDWSLLFQEFIKSSPGLTGEGCPSFLSYHKNLPNVLHKHFKDLVEHGVKLIAMMVREDDIESGTVNVSDMLAHKWQVIHAKGWLHMQCLESKIRVDADMRRIPVPGPITRWVRTAEYYSRLKIYSLRPEDVITSQVLTMKNDQTWTWLELNINQGVVNYADRQFQHTQDEWRQLLEILGPHGVSLPGVGELEIYHGEHPTPHLEEVSCYDYDSLLEVLPGVLQQLHDGDVRVIEFGGGRVRGTSVLRLVEKLRKSWDVRKSTSGWDVAGIYRQGTDLQFMGLCLYKPVILIRDRKEVEDTTRDTGLCTDVTWMLASEEPDPNHHQIC